MSDFLIVSEAEVTDLLGGRALPGPDQPHLRAVIAKRIWAALADRHGAERLHHFSLLAGCVPAALLEGFYAHGALTRSGLAPDEIEQRAREEALARA